MASHLFLEVQEASTEASVDLTMASHRVELSSYGLKHAHLVHIQSLTKLL